MLNTEDAAYKEKLAGMLVTLRGNRSAEEAAKAVGISVNALMKYESAQRMPRDEVKRALARYYGLKEDYFNK